MITSIAQRADRDDVAAFTRKVWAQMGFPYADRFEQFLSGESLGDEPTKYRIYMLRDGREIVAVIASTPIKTEAGAGFRVELAVVDQRRADRQELLDRVALFAAQRAVAERRYVVESQTQGELREKMYGRDLPGMESEVAGRDPATLEPTALWLKADARNIVKGLLGKYPEWRLSP